MYGTLWTFLALWVALSFAHSQYKQDPEVDYNALQLIRSKGYIGESHWVTTIDNYILGLHRIPGPKGSPPEKRPVFFLQHGLLCSSTNWLTNLANESFAYLLADAGFDVWMGNVRGNTYSRNHTTLKPSQKEFWDFTFDEHAQKDLPAMLNYVMDVSGQVELFYAGHSQGTVMGFAGFTVNQTLAKHIKAFFALAPVTTVKHIQGLFAVISEYYVYHALEWITTHLGSGELFPNNEIIKILGKNACTPNMKVIDGLCEDILFLICGFNQGDTNITRLPVYYTHTPAGTSVKNCVHFAQEVSSGRFAMFDYDDKTKNMAVYGMPKPPSYNVTELSVRTALFTGGNDWLADPTDVNASIPLLNTTGNIFYRKHIVKYEHLDFIWGLDAANEVYREIIVLATDILGSNP